MLLWEFFLWYLKWRSILPRGCPISIQLAANLGSTSWHQCFFHKNAKSITLRQIHRRLKSHYGHDFWKGLAFGPFSSVSWQHRYQQRLPRCRRYVLKQDVSGDVGFKSITCSLTCDCGLRLRRKWPSVNLRERESPSCKLPRRCLE